MNNGNVKGETAPLAKELSTWTFSVSFDEHPNVLAVTSETQKKVGMMIFNAEQEKRVRQIEIEQLMDMDIISLADSSRPYCVFRSYFGKGVRELFEVCIFGGDFFASTRAGLENCLALPHPRFT